MSFVELALRDSQWVSVFLKVNLSCNDPNLKDKKRKNVPGTVLLNVNELQQDAPSALMAKELKHGTGRNSHIILSPQPSDDPNDPLNWPQLSKDVNLLVLSLGAMLHAAVSVFAFQYRSN
jgi:hypothetical protein